MTETHHSKPKSVKKHEDVEETDVETSAEETHYREPDYRYMPQPAKPPYLLIVLLMAVSFFAGYLIFKVSALQQKLNDGGGNTANAQQQAAAPKDLKIKKPQANEHWRGDKNARYVWVTYSDYECPFCKRNHPDVVKLMGEYQGKLAWVYRQFPLPFHPKAQKSAEGSECVAELGGNDAFWKYTDEVFDKMPDLELTGLSGVASDIGVNADAFQKCLDSGKYEKTVKDQSAEGSQAGVQATPTAVLYDMQTGKTTTIEGALPYENLKTELDNFMAKK